MDLRIPRSFGSVLLLTGAFAIGWVIHQVVVQNSMDPLQPAAVLVTLAGLGLIAVGRRLEREFDPSAFVPAAEEEDSESYDEVYSPLDAEDLEEYEADEDYRS